MKSFPRTTNCKPSPTSLSATGRHYYSISILYFCNTLHEDNQCQSLLPWREKSSRSRLIHSSPVGSMLLPQVALLLKSRTPPATSHHARDGKLSYTSAGPVPFDPRAWPGGLDCTELLLSAVYPQLNWRSVTVVLSLWRGGGSSICGFRTVHWGNPRSGCHVTVSTCSP